MVFQILGVYKVFFFGGLNQIVWVLRRFIFLMRFWSPEKIFHLRTSWRPQNWIISASKRALFHICRFTELSAKIAGLRIKCGLHILLLSSIDLSSNGAFPGSHNAPFHSMGRGHHVLVEDVGQIYPPYPSGFDWFVGKHHFKLLLIIILNGWHTLSPLLHEISSLVESVVELINLIFQKLIPWVFGFILHLIHLFL